MPDDPKPVTKLSEVVGGLVASVAYARSVADAEALRIAHRYRQHELLKGLPVPRLRIRRVSISLPVVLSEVIHGRAATVNTPAEIARIGRAAFDQALTAAKALLEGLARLQNVTDEEKENVGHYQDVLVIAEALKAPDHFQAALATQCQLALVELNLAEGGGAPADSSVRDAVATAAERVFRDVMAEIIFRWTQQVVEKKQQNPAVKAEPFDADRARQSANEIMSEDFIKKFIVALRQATQEASVLAPTVPPDFAVSVNTGEIKNSGGGPDSVTRLNMVLLEEGLEWLTETHSDGSASSKLTVE